MPLLAGILILTASQQPTKFNLKLKLAANQVLKYIEEGSSQQVITLPSGGQKIPMSSEVKGSLRIAVAKLTGPQESSIVILIHTDKSNLVSPLSTPTNNSPIPDQSKNATLDFDGKLSYDKKSGYQKVNPALIAAPLTIVPILAPLPAYKVAIGEAWQASNVMFRGLGLDSPGSVATFKLANVRQDGSDQIAEITGTGLVPLKYSADQMEQEMASQGIASPSLNMSVDGRVEWKLTEELNLTTGTVESVCLQTKTNLKLHLLSLNAVADDVGSGAYDMTIKKPSNPKK